MMKCLVINLLVKKQSIISLPVRPVVADLLPINHINEKVKTVAFITQMLADEIKLNTESEIDLLIYTE